MDEHLRIKGRLRSIGEPGRKGTMLTFSVLTFDKITDQIKALLSKRVMLFNFAEAVDHIEQATLPLPVLEIEKAPPQLITIKHQPIEKPIWQFTDKDHPRPVILNHRRFKQIARNSAKGKIPDDIGDVEIRFYFSIAIDLPDSVRLHRHGTVHEDNPPIGKLIHCVLDALLVNREAISKVTASKVWTNSPGYIEVIFL